MGSFAGPLELPPGFGVRQSSAALASSLSRARECAELLDGRRKSGRGLPHSKTWRNLGAACFARGFAVTGHARNSSHHMLFMKYFAALFVLAFACLPGALR